MNIPKQIIANRTIYQPSNTMLWTDNINGINIQDCNNYMEPINTYHLNNIREEKYNTFLEYYEIIDGNTESIIEITKTNLDFLIEFNIISAKK
jgi:hypothetical protein